jgi:hypothetical protein
VRGGGVMSAQFDREKWMLPEELSELTGLSVNRLMNLRYKRERFPFHKIPGTRVVLYDRAEVESIIRESRVEVVA